VRGMSVSPLPPHVELLSPPRDSDVLDEWYGLTSPDHFWFEWRLEATLRQLHHLRVPLHAPLRGLDIGGGTGVLRGQLEARTAWYVDITDLNSTALKSAAPGRGRTLCYDVEAEEAPLAGVYDVVLLYDVLEHVEATRPFVQAVLRHVKPGGLLLVNVPAGPGLFSAYDTAAGHVRRYDRVSLAAEFVGTGLEIRDLRYWGLLLLPMALLRKWMLSGSAGREETLRSGFKPPNPVVHAMLRAWLRAETALVPRPPRGSSLLLAGRKAGLPSTE
jgi:2-polyprenyl-3-methyl-5-hydroxy-6-metoxy-1,4-benzoquinol methylase